MVIYEQAYITIQREKKTSTQFLGPQNESVDREEVVRYLQKKQKKKRNTMIGCGILCASIPLLLLILYLSHVEGMTLKGVLITAAGMLAAGALLIFMEKKEYNAFSPVLFSDKFAPTVLEDKLRRERSLSWKKDMVSVASVLKGHPYYLAPGSNTSGKIDSYEKSRLELFVREYMRRPDADLSAVNGRIVNPREAQESAVVDLRSAEERQMELDGNKQLGHKQEALAQEMAAFMQTHDTGNNPDALEAFREQFRARAEGIAINGGRKALQQVYYRIKYLCAEKGINFHSGAVDHVFEGQYWRG